MEYKSASKYQNIHIRKKSEVNKLNTLHLLKMNKCKKSAVFRPIQPLMTITEFILRPEVKNPT